MIPTARGPQTRPWLALLLSGLAGCQTAPAVVSTPAARPPPMMWLCGHAVPAEAGAVRAEVLRHVTAGTPVEAACARMEELGFSCLYPFKHMTKPQSYQRRRSLPELIVGRDAQRDKRFRTLVCRTSGNEVGNWSPRYFPLTVKLPFDETGALTGEVEVAGEWEFSEFKPRDSLYARFFSGRPELREPVGLPVAQARAVMQAHHFYCADVTPDGQGRGRRPYLDCYAYDDGRLLGGKIVRVHLFYDEAGTVSEVEVVQKPRDFDTLRCWLPHEGDTASGGLVKVALLPAKMGGILAIYGLEVAVFGILGGGIGLH